MTPLNTNLNMLYTRLLLLYKTTQAKATLFFLPLDFGFGLSASALFDFAFCEAPPLPLRFWRMDSFAFSYTNGHVSKNLF